MPLVEPLQPPLPSASLLCPFSIQLFAKDQPRLRDRFCGRVVGTVKQTTPSQVVDRSNLEAYVLLETDSFSALSLSLSLTIYWCSTSLLIREMQIKCPGDFTLYLLEWLLSKEWNTESVGKDVGMWEPCSFLVGMPVSVFVLENSMEVKNNQTAKVPSNDSAIHFIVFTPKI